MFLISMGLPNVLSHVDSSPDLAAFFLWFSSPCYVKRRKHCQKKTLLLFEDCEMHHAYMSNHVGDRVQNGTPL
jgi:hypothetical protein